MTDVQTGDEFSDAILRHSTSIPSFKVPVPGRSTVMIETPKKLYLFGLLLVCALVAGAFYVEELNSKRYQAETRSAVLNHLYNARNRLENNLISDVQLAKGLIAAIATNPELDQAEFDTASRALLHKHTQLKGFSAAPDSVIRMIHPLPGNEAALNLDLSQQPGQWEAVERAQRTGQTVLAGPVDLVEGGSAFIARMPVYLNNDRGERYFWGIVSALIDQQSLLINSDLLNSDLPIEIAIRGKDARGAEGDVFYGRPALFNEQSVVTEIQLPVGSWQIAAIGKDPLLNPEHYLWPMRLGYGLASALLLFAFLGMARALLASARAQRATETARAELSQSLQTLHERESLLRTVIDELPDVMLLKDKDGNFLLANATVARLYNTTPEAMVGKYDADFGVPEEMAEFMRNNVKEIMAHGQTEVVFEDSVDTATGEVRHFKSIKKPFFDAEGNSQILVIAHDITDIINARNQVQESEDKLRTILDNVDACIYLKDRDGNYLFANRPVRELWNTEMEEIVGFGDEKFFDAETASTIKRNDRLVLDRGKTLRVEETNHVPHSGETFTYQSTKLPLHREDGSIYALCGVSVDISEIKRIEQALRDSEQRFKIAGQAAYDLIYEWDVHTDTLSWFGDIDTILGFGPGEVSHQIESWLDLIHPEDQAQLADAVELHRCSTEAIRYNYRIRHHNGSYRYWSDHALPLLDDAGNPYKWVGVCTDITTQKEQQAQLEHNAYHDKLTGLPNRSLLSDRLRQAMRMEQRREQQLAVVYIDLDGFKQINDSHGHDTGDHLLIAIGRRFQQVLREGDTIARLGGDEFVAVLIDIDDTAASIPLLRRLLQAISQPILVDDLVLQVSASLGVTFYPQADEVDADQLLRQADQAMYQAKLAGKNRYYFFDTEHDRSLRGRHENLDRIASALEQQEFELYYQPKVNMRSGDVVGMEALIRWNHPEEGLLPPGAFLPVLEDQPLAIELGEWVIDNALQQIERWQAQGLSIPVSVNIGALQLQQSNFVEQLQTLLARHPRVKPQQLELEVLETSALQDIGKVSQVMKGCQAIGVNFALDDFGTGYSSLTYLKHLPAAVLKIDRTFVRDMLDDPDDLAILEGIMGMSAAFRRTVIAEGVEDIEHGILLLQLGCELAQGFGIARPMPASEVPTWIVNWRPPEVWQHQQRISRDDLSLLFAIIEHRAWVQFVDKFIHDHSHEQPPFDPSQCRFGQWLYTEGGQGHGGTALFEEIVEVHKQVHLYGEEICQLHQQGKAQAALARWPELVAASEQLVRCLQILLNQHRPDTQTGIEVTRPRLEA